MTGEAHRTPAIPRDGVEPPAALGALASAVETEARLLNDLIAVMRAQRSCVAADDLQGVDESVFSTHRILVTLGEARRQRRSLGQLVAGTDDLGIGALEKAFGDRIPDPLRDALGSLRTAALTLSREVETNRQLLRAALSNGGEALRGLYGADDGYTYRRGDTGGGRATSGGVLIDRQA